MESGMNLGLERLGARLCLHIWHNDLFSLLNASLLGVLPKETSNRKHKQFGPFLSLAAEKKTAKQHRQLSIKDSGLSCFLNWTTRLQ